jgi:thymidylate kinase
MSTSPAIHPTLDRAVRLLDGAALLGGRSASAAVAGATDDLTLPVVPRAAAEAPALLLGLGFAEIPDDRGAGRLLATYDRDTDRWLRLRLLPEPSPTGSRAARGGLLRPRTTKGAGPGMLVAIMGPDGAGKSTLSHDLAASFILPVSRHYAGLYPAGRRRHRVPGLGLTALLLRLSRMRLAATAQRARGRLVLFDRYAYDALLPLPPNARLKSRIRRALLARAFPIPDLLIVLDAPVDVLHGRRREHPVEVVEAHRRFYADLARSVPNAVVVDAAAEADAVRRAVTDLIWRRHVERRLRRAS